MTQFFVKIVLMCATIFMTASIAFAALTVDAAKQQGLIGEKPDGMLGIVAASNPEVTSLVNTVNAERAAKYNALAAKNGTGLAQVQALAGKKLIERAASGEYVMNSAGVWQKK